MFNEAYITAGIDFLSPPADGHLIIRAVVVVDGLIHFVDDSHGGGRHR